MKVPLLPPPDRRDWLNAEVVAWQARYRVMAAAAGGAIALLLRVLDFAAARTVWAAAALVVTYAALAHGAGHLARIARPLPRWLRAAVPLADLGLIFGLVALFASPAHYDRALVLSLFTVLLAQLYFGTASAVIAFRASVVAYAALLTISASMGTPIAWAEDLFTLALYSGAGGLVALVHASRQRRLASLVRLFERLEEGDFTHPYDARLDRRPDAVTAMGRAYDRMRTQLATIVLTDPLSGCLNRRGFEQQLAREVARAERTGDSLALLAVDLDRFKQVNDAHGHLVGDAVIRETGRMLRERARTGDVVARTGGEEFVLVLPATDDAGAAIVAARIVEAFRAHPMPELGRAITVSVGVASVSVPDLGVAEDLKARADEALYSAKRAGRDRVVVWRATGEPALVG